MQTIRDNASLIELIVLLSPIVLTLLRWIYKKVKITTNLLQKIYDEMQPNHGSSLFDRMRRIENMLISFDNKNRLLLATFKDGLYECDTSGKCIWTNKSLQDMFGLSEVEILGTGWLKCIKQDERIKIWDYWQACIEKNIPYEMKYQIENYKTGKTYKIETLANPQINDKEQIVGYFGVLKVVEEIDE